MGSAGDGGIRVEFISRSWDATSMRNFAAVAINPSLGKSICTLHANFGFRPGFSKSIEEP